MNWPTVTDVVDGEVSFGYSEGGEGEIYLGSLDVAAHEYTHGVIGATSKLTGAGQPGVVGEAVCDMFGIVIEKYFENSISDWALNEDNSTIRRMDQPWLLNFPAALYDDNWCYSDCPTTDFIHHNSTFISHWFYLVCVGKDWWPGIGSDKAAFIVYLAVTEHLVETSNWFDFRDATLAVVREEYGECSDEHITLLRAWKEVNMESSKTCVQLNSGKPDYGDQVTLYPNPTHDIVTLGLELPDEQYNVVIYNTFGEIVEQRTLPGTGAFRLSVLNLTAGMYVIEIQTINDNIRIWNTKFIKL